MPVVTVKKPKVIIFDLTGTAVKSHFVEQILMGHLKNNLKEFLTESWEKVSIMKDIKKLKEQVASDREKDANVPEIKGDTPEAERQSIYDNVMYYIDNNLESPAHQTLKFSCWFDAYKSGKIKTPIYSDVTAQLKKWKMDSRTKIYVFSNGWVEAQKIFLSSTNQGDLSFLIEGYFDSETAGDLNRSRSYRKILEMIREEPGECIFLTKSGKQASAAAKAGIRPILVLTHKQDVKKQKKEYLDKFPRIRTFHELQFE